MIPLLVSALATVATAGDIHSDDATSWTKLDSELAALAQNAPAPSTSSIKIWGYIRASAIQGDFDNNNNGVEDPADHDQSGFKILQARPYIDGTIGKYSFEVSLETSSGTVKLFNAWGKLKCTDWLTTTLGRFKQPFLRTFMLADNKLAFVERTIPAAAVGRYDQGAMIDGTCVDNRLHWWFAAQNGDDGTNQKFLSTGRVAFALLGKDIPMMEGALAARDEADCSVSVSVEDDSFYDKGTSVAGEVVYNQRPFSVQAEVVNLDKDIPNGDRTPYSATVGYLLTPQWEGLLRYEDTDNAFNTKRITGGANYYVSGHDVKWQINVGNNFDSKTNGIDGNFAEVGLTVSF